MRVALFIPCYINQFYPQVAIATLELLESIGLSVDYPQNQTCCGQPLANSGFEHTAKDICGFFVENFKDYDAIIAPSGSCVHYVKKHYDILPQTSNVRHVRENIFELCTFLDQYPEKIKFTAKFPYKVALHQSCHGLRGLRMGKSSELVAVDHSIVRDLLSQIQGVELIEADRADECCGFGGTFAVKEQAVSVKMAKDRLSDYTKNKAEVITATDMSCLMHLEGVVKKKKWPVKIMHVAEILNYKGE